MASLVAASPAIRLPTYVHVLFLSHSDNQPSHKKEKKNYAHVPSKSLTAQLQIASLVILQNLFITDRNESTKMIFDHL